MNKRRSSKNRQVSATVSTAKKRQLRYQTLERRELLAAEIAPIGSAFAPGTPQSVIDQWEAFEHPETLPGASGHGSGLSSPILVGNPNWRWANSSQGSSPNQGDGIKVTWGIVSDGTMTISGGTAVPSNLVSFMDSIYGNGNTTIVANKPWFHLFKDAYDSWSAVSGINFVYEPNDDGTPIGGTATGLAGIRADFRVTGAAIDGDYNVLARNYLPGGFGSAGVDGDMIIDTSDVWFSSVSDGPTGQNRGLHNVLAHEIGHGLGLDHADPVNNSKLMEASATLSFYGQQEDDIYNANLLYGDRFEVSGGNNTMANASNIGTLALNKSTVVDFVSIDNSNTDRDFYRFTVTQADNLSIKLTPSGTSYLVGPQNGATSTVNRKSQSDLAFRLYDSAGTLLDTQAAAPNGKAEFNTSVALPSAGNYYVEVYTTSGFESQAYQLTAQLGAPLVVGPSLLAVRPDSSDLLASGDTLNVTPREINLLFRGGSNLDEATIAGNVRLIRAGGDGVFGDANDVVVNLGYVGLLEPGDASPDNLQQIVMRPASIASENVVTAQSSFPDDLYRIQIIGSGASPLASLSAEAFNAGQDKTIDFRLDRGAQVVSVVPQPITRGTGNALTQAADKIVVYFDDQRLNVSDATDPKFFRLVNTKSTLSSTDDETMLPVSASYVYDSAAKRNEVTLTFATAIPEGTYRLDIGRAAASDTGGATSINVGTLFTDSASVTSGYSYNGFLGDKNGVSNSTTDTDNYKVALRANATLSVTLTPHSTSLRMRARVLDSTGAVVVDATNGVITGTSAAGATLTLPTFTTTVAGNYTIEVTSPNGSTGSYLINASVANSQLTIDDNNSSFGLATDLGAIGGAGVLLKSQIESQPIPLPLYAGSNDEPGHREIQRESHIGSLGTGPAVPSAITLFPYSFPATVTNALGVTYQNFLSDTEKEIARSIFEIYANLSGYEFYEVPSGGMRVFKGDIRAIDPTLSPGQVGGKGGASLVVIDGLASNSVYGDGFTNVLYHEIGHGLGLGHSSDQPSVMDGNGGGPQNDVLPGDVDVVHLQRIVTPNSTDIDLYKFSVTEKGQFTAETFAERLTQVSFLSTVLRLYKEDASGQRQLIAQNGRYYGNDSYLNVELEPGTYYVGVSSRGNESYDPNVPDSGFGGTTDGNYELKLNFAPVKVNVLRDVSGTTIDGDSNGTPGGLYSFWFQASDAASTIFVDRINDPRAALPDGNGSLANPYDTISTALTAAANRIVVPNNATAAMLLNERFTVNDGLKSVTFTIGGIGTDHIAVSGSASNIATQIRTAITNAITAGRLTAGSVGVGGSGRVVQLSGSSNLTLQFISRANADSRTPTFLDTPNIVRIVGNGGGDGNINTPADNRPYLIGLDSNNIALRDGREFLVPQGATVMVDAGALIKMSKSNIDVGSSSIDLSRDGAAIQMLGNPTLPVYLRSYNDDSFGGDSNGVGVSAAPGNFGGIVIRNDSDMESQGIFLNYVNHTDIRHGGGKVFVNSVEQDFSPIHVVDARPTISFNQLSNNLNSAISASPDSFDDSLGRIGPDVHGNALTSNSINGLFIRISTLLGEPVEKLTVNGRFDDTDIAHILQQNLVINGNPGGPLQTGAGLQARAAGRLVVDPGIVLKLGKARIEAQRGAASLIAEGTSNLPVIFTSTQDDRYGGSGVFDTNSGGAAPAAGDWAGLFFGEVSSGSLDHTIVSYAGGDSPIRGGSTNFNAIEIHQATVRVANSVISKNAGGNAADSRDGRGANEDASIYVRGAQPIIVNNTFVDNLGPVININASSLKSDIKRDSGRSTGFIERFADFDDNAGPLVRGNKLADNDINGMQVRGEVLTVESTWDDTDIVHVLTGAQSLVTVDNLHTYGGLTLQSSNSESLVIKLLGANAGFTATGTPVDIEDRIGGTIHVLGTPGHAVVMTSLNDNSVGAGFTPNGSLATNTYKFASNLTSGDWRGLRFDEYSNDRNVAIVRERENALTHGSDINDITDKAQVLGELVNNDNASTTAQDQAYVGARGDENRRLGFEVHGFISPDDPNDVDVYSFIGTVGTPVWIDIDRTDSTLDTVVELLNSTGTVVARSDRSLNSGGPNDLNANSLVQNVLLGGDFYTQNFRDSGMYLTLPGTTVGTKGNFFIRVRSNPQQASAAGITTIDGQSRGRYQLQIRLQQVDEFPGSTVQYADIRYANTGIDVRGLPSHSPLISEVGEYTNSNNNTLGQAQTLVNLLQTDMAAIGLSGALSDNADVDWYSFELNHTDVQFIPGANGGGGTVAVVFDMDFADGAVRADNTLAVYDGTGRLIFVGRESNIEDDITNGDANKLKTLDYGSIGNKDAYIGPVHLPASADPGAPLKYYVAVMSNRSLPAPLLGAYTANTAVANDALTRLEPINSVTRVVEDHIGFNGYRSAGSVQTPTTSGIFDISTSAALDANHIKPFTFADVALYVATATNSTGDGDRLYTVNPLAATQQTQVSGTLVAGQDDIQDIVMRSDGRMFGYQRQNAATGRVGGLVELNPETGAAIGAIQPDNIRDNSPTPNITAFANNIPNRVEQFTTSSEVDAVTFQRRGTTGPSSAPVPVYETYYSVREGDNTLTGITAPTPNSKLYRGNQDGNATPALASGGSQSFGYLGDIQPAGVTFASRTVTVSDNATTPNRTDIRIESKIPGSFGNLISINVTRPNNAAANVLSVTGNTTTGYVINLELGGTGGPPITGAPSASAIVDAINNDPEASRIVTAVIVGGNSSNATALNVGGVAGFLTGGSNDTTVAPLKGRVTGLSFSTFDGSGSLYGVTSAGEFLVINPSNGVVTSRVDTASTLGVTGLNFQGLALGPQNLEGGKFKNTLFAITSDKRIVAFDTTGNGVVAFESGNASQLISLAAGVPSSAGSFTLTFNNQTTLPISVNAPTTTSVNEQQTLSTAAYGGTFTLSVVDDQGAISSPTADITATDTSFVTQSAALAPAAPFVIRIDGEEMLVGTRVGNNLSNITRGINGTTAAAHLKTSTVFEVVSSTLTAAKSTTGTTVLTAAITNNVLDNTFTVFNAAAIAIGSSIRVGSEVMTVTNVVGNQLTVIRAAQGTTIANHSSFQTVQVISDTVTVRDGQIFPVSTSILRIDNEDMLIVGRSGNDLTVLRGWNGTAIAAHAINANVYRVETTAAIAYNATAAQVQAALAALPSVGAGNVTVTGGPLTGTVAGSLAITFAGNLAGRNMQAITSDLTGLVGDEIQRITGDVTTTAGTFRLQFNGSNTAALNFNADAAQVQAALEALPTIGAGNVSVTGTALPGGTLSVQFLNERQDQNVNAITLLNQSLTYNRKQQLATTGISTGGDFTLSLNDAANGLAGTTAPIVFNANAAAIQAALIAAIPALNGNITVTGGPINSAAVTIEFNGTLAATNVATMGIANNLTGIGSPAIGVSVLSPINITTTRDGQAVAAPLTTVANGVLSVYDALVGLNNIAPADIRLSGTLAGGGVTVNFQGAYAGTNVTALTVDNSLMLNNTAASVAITGAVGDGIADSPVSNTIANLNASAVGLAFSPLDFNLWHPTTMRSDNAGHGVNQAPDGSRTPSGESVTLTAAGGTRNSNEGSGGASFMFGFERWEESQAAGVSKYLTYNPAVNAQYGILTTAFHQDLSSNPRISGAAATTPLTASYNLPGGGYGTLTSTSFSLAGSQAADRPTLYVNYFLDTQNHHGSDDQSNGSDPFRDSARVFISTDGGTTWELVATNNSQLSAADVAGNQAELPGFLSHLSDAGLNATPGNARPETKQIVQELFDSTGQWRQVRVDLSRYANQANLRLRFDFSTAGAMNDTSLGALDTTYGEFTSGSRSIRSTENLFEGFYIDDIIVGYAERGEMVTSPSNVNPNSSIVNLNTVARTVDSSPGKNPDILQGAYQMEMRRTTGTTALREYATLADSGIKIARTYDTNDSHSIEITETARVNFETPISTAITTPVVLLGNTIPALAMVPWTQNSVRPFEGTQSIQSGAVNGTQQISVFQKTSAELGVTGTEAGVIQFAFSVSSAETINGLRFFIDGVIQDLIPLDADEGGSGTTTTLASGDLSYRTVSFAFGAGSHTFTWVYDYRNASVTAGLNSAFIDDIRILQGGTGMGADKNRTRPQGMLILDSNVVSQSRTVGINIQPGNVQGGPAPSGLPHPGSTINFPSLNTERLVPGVVVQNNIVVGRNGIRFAGDTVDQPNRAVPFGRIVNNTLVGNEIGTGISVLGNASPTLMNNIITGFTTGISVGARTSAAIPAPVIRSNFFQANNGNNGVTGTDPIIVVNATDPLFVDAANGNYYPVATTLALDSSLTTLDDRSNYVTFKSQIGLPQSNIVAPERDALGQKRVDSSSASSGGGASVFIDRGAVDRSDSDAPFAVLLNPTDNDSSGQDRDPNSSVVYLTSSVLENFTIFLGDGRGPSAPFEGTGVNPLTVHDVNDATVAVGAVTVLHDGIQLEQGVEYSVGYNPSTGVLLLTPLSSLWDPTGVYTVILNNLQISDLAGNLLRPNQPDGTTKFFVLMPDVRLDYGDAPDSYGTLLGSNGARHTLQPGATPRFGNVVDSEDRNFVVTLPQPTTVLTVDGTSITVSSSAVGGETVKLTRGTEAATFEFVAPGNSAATGNVAVNILLSDSATQLASKLVAAINGSVLASRVSLVAAANPNSLAEVNLLLVDDLADQVVITSSSGLFATTVSAQGTQVKLSALPVGGEQVTVRIASAVVTFELVNSGFAPQQGNVAISIAGLTSAVGDTPATISNKLATLASMFSDAINASLIEEGNTITVTVDPASSDAVLITALDDEDGVAIGNYNNGTSTHIAFLDENATSPTTAFTDVIGFLNPQDIQGTTIAVSVLTDGYLDAWIDFDGDGAFDPTREQIFKSQFLTAGVNRLTVFTPAGTADRVTWARFRISDSGGLAPTGLAIGGEVEDYQVEIINVSQAVPSDDNFQVDEDGVLDTITDVAQASLFDNDLLSPERFLPSRYIVDTQPQFGTLTTDPLTGRFVYTPNGDYHGKDTFTYWVSTQPLPGSTLPANATLATVTIHIKPVNDKPLAEQKQFAAVEEQTLTITAAQLIANAIADEDPRFPASGATAPWNEDNQTFKVVSLNINGTVVTSSQTVVTPRATFVVTFNAVGFVRLRFTGNKDLNRDNDRGTGAEILESFDFTIQDDGKSLDPFTGALTTIQGTPLQDTKTAYIRVAPTNDTPTPATDFVTIGPIGTSTPVANAWSNYYAGLGQAVPVPTEDQTLVIPAAFLISNDISGTLIAADENKYISGNDALLKVISASVNNRDATVSVNPTTGDITFVPPKDVYGNVVITYVVEDSGIDEDVNGVRTVKPLRATGTITVTLQPINDIPVTYNRALTFNESAAAGVDNPPHVFTAADLINGTATEADSVPGLFDPTLPAPFNETEQLATLRVVTFTTNAGTVDGRTLPGGTGMLTLASDHNGLYEFDFVNSAFVSGRFYPAADYNRRTPFAANETFKFAIEDDGATTDPDAVGRVITLPRETSLVATMTLSLLPANDAPIFTMPSSYAFDENKGATVVQTDFITAIAPAEQTALDELQRQRVTFSVTAINVPNGLMTALPQVTITQGAPNNWSDGRASLTVFPAADAFGFAVYDITATDGGDAASGAARSTTHRVTIAINPVNDDPVAYNRALSTTEAVEVDGQNASITFTAAQLIVGSGTETPSVPGLFPGSLIAPYNESEQTLRVVAFQVPGAADVDVTTLTGGSGTVTRTTSTGGTLSFTFLNGAFTTGTYTPSTDYNRRLPFSSPDRFSYVISDDGLTTLPGSGFVNFNGSNSNSSINLPELRSLPATVSLSLLPANDPPIFTLPSTFTFDENDGSTVVQTDFITSIAPAEQTALDELVRQGVTFSVAAVNVPAGLMTALPIITITQGAANNWADGRASLTVFPAADAFGFAVYDITALDGNDAASGAARSTTKRITIAINPINDDPVAFDRSLNVVEAVEVDGETALLTFTAADLLNGKTPELPNVAGAFPPSLISPYNETEQALRVVAFNVPGAASVDVKTLTGGTGTFIRRTANNSVLTFTFQNGAFVSGTYRPPVDYNQRTPFVPEEVFSYAISDDGKTTLPGSGFVNFGGSATNSTITLAERRSAVASITLTVTPANDPPIFDVTLNTSSQPIFEILERDDLGTSTIFGAITGIYPAVATALDERARQTVSFNIRPDLSTVPAGLMAADPIISNAFVPTIASISFFPAVDAVGTAVYVFEAIDAEPGTPGFVPRTTLGTFTVLVRPVNDAPRVASPAPTDARAADPDELWTVDSATGTIRYTLREDNAAADGSTSPYLFYARQVNNPANIAAGRIGLLDPYTVGPGNEADSTLGGRQNLRIISLPVGTDTLVTGLGGTLNVIVRDANGYPTVFNYIPPADYNSNQGDVDFFDYVIEDDAAGRGETWDFTTGGLVENRLTRTARAEFLMNPVNDAPLYSITTNVLSVLEDAGPVTVSGFISDIQQGPSTAGDELSGQVVSFKLTALSPENGLFAVSPAIGPDGVLSFTTASDAVGSVAYRVEYQDDGVNDPTRGDINSRPAFTITVNVRPVNDQPRLETTVTGTSDPNGTADDNWSVNSSGVITYTLREDTLGPNGASAFVIDSRRTSQNGRVGLLDVFNVGPANEVDSTLGGSQVLNLINVPAKTTLGGTLTVLSRDANGNPTRIQYTPPANVSISQTARDSFSYTVQDDAVGKGETWNLGTDSLSEAKLARVGRVEFVLSAVNDAPIFSVPTPEISVVEDDGSKSIAGFATGIAPGPAEATDEVGQTVAFQLAPQSPENGLFTVSPFITPTGTLSFTAAPDAFGTIVYSVTLVDSGANNPARGDVNTSIPVLITINVRPVNDAPRLNGAVTGTRKTTTANEAWAVDNAGKITYTMGEDNAPVAGGSAPYIIDIARTASAADRIGLLDPYTVGPNNEASSLLGGSQALRITNIPAETELGGKLAVLARDADGFITQISYTPIANYNSLQGPRDSFEYDFEDSSVAGETWDIASGALVADRKSGTGRVEFVINPLNDPPSFTGAPDITVDEDVDTTGIAGQTIVQNFVENIFAGPDGADDELSGTTLQSVRFVVTAQPGNTAGLFSTVPTVAADGTLSFTTAKDANGLAVFTIVAVDSGSNAAPLQSNRSAAKTFSITVNPVNDNPTFTGVATVTVNEDSGAYSSSTPYATQISAGATNESGQTLTFIVNTPAASASLFTVPPAIDAAGFLTFTTAANAVGTAVVSVTLQDSLGGTSATVPLTITISEVNDAPVASDFEVSGDEDNTTVVTRDQFLSLAVDPDLVSNSNENLSIVQLPATTTKGASISLNANGDIVYDPRSVAAIQALKPGQTITDVFTYKLRDTANALSATATVTVTVAGRNDAPFTVADNAILVTSRSTVLRPLTNDGDIDGTVDPATIFITQQPAHGTLTVNPDGTLLYTSEAGYRGIDTIGYTVADDLGQQSEQAIITLDIAPLPTIDPTRTGSYIGESVTVDLSQAPDPTGTLDLSSITIVRPPSNGTAQVSPDGKISYTANPNFVGTDTFDYTIKDNSGRVSQPITVTVSTVNSRMQNPFDRTDVNANGQTTAFDALLIINYIGRNVRAGKGNTVPVLDTDRGPNFYDVDGNRIVAAIDALRVVNEVARLNRLKSGSGEGEAAIAAPTIQSISTSLTIESAPVEPVWTDMVEDHAVATFQGVQATSDDLLDAIVAGQPNDDQDENDTQDLDLLDQVFSTF